MRFETGMNIIIAIVQKVVVYQRPKSKVFTIQPSVLAAEYEGWIWPEVKFRIFFLNGLLNSRKYCQCKLSIVTKQICSNVKFSSIWIQRLFQRLIWINYQNCIKKLHTYLLKTLETLSCSKSPLFLRISVLSASVSVFGLRPDIFPARYSVLV